MNFFPLVLDQALGKIKELAAGEKLDLQGSDIVVDQITFPDGSIFDNYTNIDGGAAATVFSASEQNVNITGGAA
jgi:hypothetical protein